MTFGAFLARYTTTEGVFSAVGFVWFVLSAFIPAVPMQMPLPPFIPGLTAITPGLLVAISLLPVLIKAFNPATTAFVNQPKPVVSTTTATVTTTVTPPVPPAPTKPMPDGGGPKDA